MEKRRRSFRNIGLGNLRAFLGEHEFVPLGVKAEGEVNHTIFFFRLTDEASAICLHFLNAAHDIGDLEAQSGPGPLPLSPAMDAEGGAEHGELTPDFHLELELRAESLLIELDGTEMVGSPEGVFHFENLHAANLADSPAPTSGQAALLMLSLELMKLAPFPTPRALMDQWQSGKLEREEMHRLMGEHQKALLNEAEVYYQNPIAGYIEGLLNKRAARRLINDHGEAAVRELFLAMSWMPDFGPSAYLWNADHWDVELHAFLRTKTGPVFRVRELMVKTSRAVMLIEHGSPKKSLTTRERVTFTRDWRGQMEVVKRELV